MRKRYRGRFEPLSEYKKPRLSESHKQWLKDWQKSETKKLDSNDAIRRDFMTPGNFVGGEQLDGGFTGYSAYTLVIPPARRSRRRGAPGKPAEVSRGLREYRGSVVTWIRYAPAVANGVPQPLSARPTETRVTFLGHSAMNAHEAANKEQDRLIGILDRGRTRDYELALATLEREGLFCEDELSELPAHSVVALAADFEKAVEYKRRRWRQFYANLAAWLVHVRAASTRAKRRSRIPKVNSP